MKSHPVWNPNNLTGDVLETTRKEILQTGNTLVCKDLLAASADDIKSDLKVKLFGLCRPRGPRARRTRCTVVNPELLDYRISPKPTRVVGFSPTGEMDPSDMKNVTDSNW